MISTFFILRRLLTLILISSLVLDPRWAGAAIVLAPVHPNAATLLSYRLQSEALGGRAEPFNGFTRVFVFPQRAQLLREEGKAFCAWRAGIEWGYRHPVLSLAASFGATFAIASLFPGHGRLLYAMNFLIGVPLNLLPKGSGKPPVVLCSLYDDPQSEAVARLNAKLAALTRDEPDTAAMAALRLKIQTYLARDMGVSNEALPDIYFVNPPGGRTFFQDGNAYGAVHFNAQAIYFSLPILRALDNQENQDALLQDIVTHIAAHLQGEPHAEATAYEQRPEKLNGFLRMLWEEQMEFEEPESETPAAEGWTPQQKSLLDTIVRIPQSAPPYSDYHVLLKTDKVKKSNEASESEETKPADKRWFESTIKAYGLGWRWELTLYPFEKGRCAFGHAPNWVFNWIHDDTKTLIPVGPEEVLTFGLLSVEEKKAAQKKIRDPNIQANDEEPYLRTALTLLQQPSVLNALLEQPEFNVNDYPDERLALLGFARIATTPDYYGRVNVLRQRIAYEDHRDESVQLTAQRLDRVMEILRRLVDEGLTLDHNRTIPTVLQILAGRLAVAQRLGRRDDFERYGSLAAQTARHNRELGFFSRRWVAITRSLGIGGNPHHRRYGKPLDQLRTFAFIGSGTAHGSDALRAAENVIANIGGEGNGVQLDKIEIHDVDASQAVLNQAKMMTQNRTWKSGTPVNYFTHQANVKRGLPFKAGTVDWLETGLLDDIGAGDGPAAMAGFLREINRVMAEDGYLVLTNGNNAALHWALDRLGFDVLTEPDAEIRFAAGSLGQLAPEDADQRDRLRSRVSGTGYVVAVKRQTVRPWEQRQMTDSGELVFDANGELREDPAVLEALASWRTAHFATQVDEGRHLTRRPEHVDIGNVAYDQSNADAAVPSGITRGEIAERFPDFAAHLECLRLAAEDNALGPRQVLRLTRFRALYESHLSGPLEFMDRADMAWRDLFSDFGFTTVLPRKDAEWVERRIKGRRTQPHVKGDDDETQDKEDELADASPAIDVPTTGTDVIPKDSLWAVYGPKAAAAAPVEFVPDIKTNAPSEEETTPASPSTHLPSRVLAPEIEIWRRLIECFPEAADILGILFAKEVFAFRSRNPLAARDVLTTQLQSLSVPLAEGLLEGILEILGITPEILAHAEAARTAQMLERALQKIRGEILRAKGSKTSVADLFDIALASRIIALANADADTEQIENAIQKLQGKITAARILEILRDYRLVKEPEPIPEPWSWAAPLAETLEAAYRNQYLDRDAWLAIVRHWQKEKQPLTEKDHKALLAAADRASASTGMEALTALRELVFLLNRDYLRKKQGQNSLLTVSFRLEDGTKGIKAFVLEVEPQPVATYFIKDKRSALTFFRAKQLRTSWKLEGAHPAYFAIPGLGGVFVPSGIRDRANNYTFIETEARRDGKMQVDLAPDDIASQWTTHVHSPSPDALYSQLETEEIERHAYYETALARGTLKAPADELDPDISKSIHFTEEAVRKESALYVLGAAPQASGLLNIPQKDRMTGAGEVLGLLCAARQAKTPLRIFYGVFYKLLVALFENQGLMLPVGQIMLLTLLAQKLSPSVLQDGVYRGNRRDILVLSHALLSLSPEELELLIDEIIEENFHFRLELRPNNTLHWVAISDADRGRLGPFTAQRLARLFETAYTTGRLDSDGWDIMAAQLEARFGPLLNTVKAAAVTAVQPPGNRTENETLIDIITLLKTLNADFLAGHQLLLIPTLTSDRNDVQVSVIETDPNLIENHAFADYPSIRIHYFSRCLSGTFTGPVTQAGARDFVVQRESAQKTTEDLNLLLGRKPMSDAQSEHQAWVRHLYGDKPDARAIVADHLQAFSDEALVFAAHAILDDAAFAAFPGEQARWIRHWEKSVFQLMTPFLETYHPHSTMNPAHTGLIFRNMNRLMIGTRPSTRMAEIFTGFFSEALSGDSVVSLPQAIFLMTLSARLGLTMNPSALQDPAQVMNAMIQLSRFFRSRRDSDLRAAARVLGRSYRRWLTKEDAGLQLDGSREGPRTREIAEKIRLLAAALDPLGLQLPEWMIEECLRLPAREVEAMVRMALPGLTPDVEKDVLALLGVKRTAVEKAVDHLREINPDQEKNGQITPEWVEAFAAIANAEKPNLQALEDMRPVGGIRRSVKEITDVLAAHNLILTPEKRAAQKKQLVEDLAVWLKKSFENKVFYADEWPGYETRLTALFPKSAKDLSRLKAALPSENKNAKPRDIYQFVHTLNSLLCDIDVPGWTFFAEGFPSKTETVWNVRVVPIEKLEAAYAIGSGDEMIYIPQYRLAERIQGLDLRAPHFGFGWHAEEFKEHIAALSRPDLLKSALGQAQVNRRLENLSALAFDFLAAETYQAMAPAEQAAVDARTPDFEESPLVAYCDRLLRPESPLEKSYRATPASEQAASSHHVRDIFALLHALAGSQAPQEIVARLSAACINQSNKGPISSDSAALILAMLAEKNGTPIDRQALARGDLNAITFLSGHLLGSNDLQDMAQELLNENFLALIRIQPDEKISVTRHAKDSPIPLRPAFETELKAVVDGLLRDGHMDADRFRRLTGALQRALGVPPIAFPQELASGPLASRQLSDIRRFLRRWNDDYLSEHGYVVRPWLQANDRKPGRSVLKASVTPLIRNTRQTVRVSGDSKVGSHFRHTIYDDGRAVVERGLQQSGSYVGVLQIKAGSDKDEAVVRSEAILRSLNQVADDLSFAESPQDSSQIAFVRDHLVTDSPVARWSFKAAVVHTPLGSDTTIRIMLSINAGNLFSWYCLMASPGYAHDSADRIVDKVLLSATVGNSNPLSSSEIAFFGLLSEQIAALNSVLIPFTVQELRSPQAQKDRILQLRDYVRGLAADVLEKLALETLTKSFDLRFIVRSETEIEIQHLSNKPGPITPGLDIPPVIDFTDVNNMAEFMQKWAGGYRDHITPEFIRQCLALESPDAPRIEALLTSAGIPPKSQTGGVLLGYIEALLAIRQRTIAQTPPSETAAPDSFEAQPAASSAPPMSGDQLFKVSVDLRKQLGPMSGQLRMFATHPERITWGFLLELMRYPDKNGIWTRLNAEGIKVGIDYKIIKVVLDGAKKHRAGVQANLGENSLHYLLAGVFESMLQDGVLDYAKFRDLATTLETLFLSFNREALESSARAASSVIPHSAESLGPLANFIKDFNEYFLHGVGYAISAQGEKVVVGRFSTVDIADDEKIVQGVRSPSPKDLSVEDATYLLMEIVVEGSWTRLTEEFVRDLADKTLDDLKFFLSDLARTKQGIGLIKKKSPADIYAIVRRIERTAA